MVFAEKPLRPQTDGFAGWVNRMTPAVRKHPFLLYGLPFTILIVGASFAITPFTRERYERASKKITNVSREENLKLQQSRRKIDLREEYFRLESQMNDKADDWEPVRVQRPVGAKEWGESYTNQANPEQSEKLMRYERMTPEAIAERKRINAEKFAQDRKLREQLGNKKQGWLQWMGVKASSVMEEGEHRPFMAFSPMEKGDAYAGVGPDGYTKRADGVIIGPDGKPCRACNSKTMFAAAMKGMGGKTAGAAGLGAMAATAKGLAADPESCPPDGPAIGNSTWTFLHSAAAFYPDEPDADQQTAMRNLIHSLSILYPCAPCAYGLKQHLETQAEKRSSLGDDAKVTKLPLLNGAFDPGTLPEAARSGRAMRAWLCAAHNEVNSRLGKSLFSCTEGALDARWGEGPSDGRCDSA